MPRHNAGTVVRANFNRSIKLRSAWSVLRPALIRQQLLRAMFSLLTFLFAAPTETRSPRQFTGSPLMRLNGGTISELLASDGPNRQPIRGAGVSSARTGLKTGDRNGARSESATLVQTVERQHQVRADIGKLQTGLGTNDLQAARQGIVRPAGHGRAASGAAAPGAGIAECRPRWRGLRWRADRFHTLVSGSQQ
jgi:hypothetical protein